MSYLGIDVGTTGCKVVAFSERGEIIARSYREYPLYYPQTGWIELDAEEVYRAVEDSLQEVSQGLLNDPPQFGHLFSRRGSGSGGRRGRVFSAQYCNF